MLRTRGKQGTATVITLLIVMALGLSFALTPVAHAATITVTTTVDELTPDGECSLREAIIAANTDTAVDACTAGNGADIIRLPAGTYPLSVAGRDEDAAATGDLDITSDVTIIGAGAATTTIDGNQLDDVLHIVAGAATLTQATIRGGYWRGIQNAGTLMLTSSTVGRNYGTGIQNAGALTLTSSTVRDNSDAFGEGIGIFNSGTLTLTSSTISNNGGGYGGGGILNRGTATLTNSTISSNVARGAGGGIYNRGTLTLTNSTISGNISRDDAGGVYNHSGSTVNIRNSLIAGNINYFGSDLEPHDCWGTLSSQGYNLIQDPTSCTMTGNTTGNMLGVDPVLGPLQNNGGPTLTHALLPGSPAIDAGNPARPGRGENACAATDQRGVPRPKDGNGDGRARCDIGAFERKSASTP